MKPYLSVIIPAYNEEKRLRKTLKESLSWLRGENFDFEIIVIDDGSMDGTKELVLEIMKEAPEVKLESYSKNQGKGYAVRLGMLKARGKFRLFMDADASTPISELKKLLPFTRSFDIVIGSREMDKRLVKPAGFLRRVISRIGNFGIRLLLHLNFKDTQCGFKLFTEKSAALLFSDLFVFGWGFDVAILAFAQKRGFKVKEVAVAWEYSKGSKMRAVRAVFTTLFEVLKIRKFL